MLHPVALFDIDNTIYDGLSLFPLIERQASEKLVPAATLTSVQAKLADYKSGALSYEAALVAVLDVYATALKGQKYDKVLASTKSFFASSNGLYPYVEPLMGALAETHDIILITGEPQMVCEAIGQAVKADAGYSTQFEVVDGKFTGNITRYLATGAEKLGAVQHAIAGHTLRASLAFGDSEGDIEMMRIVEYAFCLNPTPALQQEAAENGWYLATPDTILDVVESIS